MRDLTEPGRSVRPVAVRLVRLGRTVIVERGEPLALEQCTHLGLAEPAVAAGRTDAADPTGGRPAGDGLRVDAEQRSHLARRPQTIASVHDPSLRHREQMDQRVELGLSQ